MVTSIFGAAAVPVQKLFWEPGNITFAEFAGEAVTIICDTHTAEQGYDLFINAPKVSGLRQALLDAGGVIVTDDAVELLRIEAGIPLYGVDVDGTTVIRKRGSSWLAIARLPVGP